MSKFVMSRESKPTFWKQNLDEFKDDLLRADHMHMRSN